ncbi:MAG: TonB-dependent receptor [Bacteroidetes bacterium]|nr:TonB-dependent receptor [Bacteroidota bacterium]MBU2585078.1 TonB-dependent receptor [Bacteroidota bacterium]
MFNKVFFVIIFIILVNLSLAQSDYHSISGKVVERHDGSPLIGVNIFIQELKLGSVTNADGNFVFKKIKSGTYTLVFSFVGHQKVIREIVVPSNESKNIFIEMIEVSINIGEVLVTGNPLLDDTKKISQSFISMSGLDLQIHRSSTIAKTLGSQPGIAIRSNGIATSRPVIRGFSDSRVLVLEDGLRMGDLSNSSDDHGVTADGNSAERIEILRGPASLLYGSNAIGGVVNILTDKIPSSVPQEFNGDIYLEGATVNSQYLGNLHLHYGIDKFSFHSNILKRKANDYRVPTGEKILNSGFENFGFNFGTAFHPVWGVMGLNISSDDFTYGIPTQDIDEAVKLTMKKKQLKFLSEIHSLGPLIQSLSLKTGFQDYHHEEIPSGDTHEEEHHSEFGLQTLSADLSIRHKKFFNNINGVIGVWGMKQKYSVTGEEAFTPNADYTSLAFYFLEKIQFGGLNIQVGTRYETNQIQIPETILSDSLLPAESKSFKSFSGSVGLVYELSERVSFFSNLANAFRAPTIEELSSFAIHEATGSFDIGNRKLNKENSIGFDFGLRFQNHTYSAEITGYYNDIQNYIFKKPANLFFSRDTLNGRMIGFNSVKGVPVFEYTQSDAVIYGIETKSIFEVTNSLTTTFILDYIRGYKRDGSNLPQIPPMRLSLELRYTKDTYWFGLQIKTASDQKQIADEESETKGYGILDIYGGYKLFTGKLAHIFGIKIENVFDKAYSDHLSAIKNFALMPGRNISLNYKFLF